MSWKYKEILEKRIENAQENVAFFYCLLKMEKQNGISKRLKSSFGDFIRSE